MQEGVVREIVPLYMKPCNKAVEAAREGDEVELLLLAFRAIKGWLTGDVLQAAIKQDKSRCLAQLYKSFSCCISLLMLVSPREDLAIARGNVGSIFQRKGDLIELESIFKDSAIFEVSNMGVEVTGHKNMADSLCSLHISEEHIPDTVCGFIRLLRLEIGSC
jgi:hypothetical protein